MIPHQLALVRREIWEHRSLYITPAVVGLIMVLTLLTAFVFASGYQEIVDIGIVGAQSLASEAHRRAALLGVLLGNTAPFLVASGILTVFYCLDCLYAERKNKSILFWRSLPITDAETVISKFLTAALAIPLIAFAVVVVTHILILLLTGIFPLFDAWTGMLIIMILLPIWFSPFIGWLLFVSAWTKRSPLLMAFLPLILVPTLEYWLFRTHLIGDAIQSRFTQLPIFKNIDVRTLFDEEKFIANVDAVSLIGYIDIGAFLSSPQMWVGIVVCGLFMTGAIYVRRYRDDS